LAEKADDAQCQRDAEYRDDKVRVHFYFLL
jgi:hypothetical protein